MTGVDSLLALEGAESYLRKATPEGHSVLEHVSEVLSTLLAQRPPDPYDAFELISESVKQQRDVKQQQVDKPSTAFAEMPLSEAQSTWLMLARKTLRIAAPQDDQRDKGFAYAPDFLLENQLLHWAGYGFSEREAFRISCSIKRLASDTPGLVSIRFWGKILGIENDYWIAEGQLEGEEAARGTGEGDDEEADPRGLGANKHTYWVLRDSAGTGEWEMLPDLLPSHIRTARRCKKLFTGDLDRPVITFPWFAGTERHLLRATIAQISSDTVICPAGLWRPKEEEPNQIEEDPEFEFPPTQELLSLDSWTHSREFINEGGLTMFPEVDEDTDEELYAEIQAKMEQDPILDATRPITEDPELPGGQTAWLCKLAGDCANYGTDGVSYAVVVMKSMRWPGAVTVYQNKKFTNVYVGYGIKAWLNPFFPVAPDDVQEDPEDLEEQPEPQPQDDELSDGASQENDEANEEDDDKEEDD
ncbi:radial spokehead family protein [Besnoitia besnoiti]|uniref:Radial spokehead family protein n=1 Tax=Besnoitia besnoiti TaxID=94643 RepID=A0A2A9MIX9_BESBE|nr:radial spokehead family protein [Besnoitia besnoiti]PFH38498.1 radial spokehead family protein [Besnoitia besnoiti]